MTGDKKQYTSFPEQVVLYWQPGRFSTLAVATEIYDPKIPQQAYVKAPPCAEGVELEEIVGRAIVKEAWAIEGLPAKALTTGYKLLGRAAIEALAAHNLLSLSPAGANGTCSFPLRGIEPDKGSPAHQPGPDHDDVSVLLNLNKEQGAIIKNMRAELLECQKIFSHYADLHFSKGTVEGSEKGSANAKIAGRIERLLNGGQL